MAKVYGTKYLDTLDGIFDGVTDGDDTIFGYGGSDQIFARGGNDILQGGEGGDYLNGGAGSDTANYGDSPTGVTVDLTTGYGDGGTAEGDTLASIENLTGSWFNDVLIGNGEANVLTGGGGDDTLYGRAGADILNGGWGVDTAGYIQSSTGVLVSLLWHIASGGDAEGDQLNSIENLSGSNHDDGLFGDNGGNLLSGWGGNDTLLGYGGNDTLIGDVRNAPSGNDSLNGGAGFDILYGGLGADSLFGGADADWFVWNSIAESAGLTSAGLEVAKTDVILDFNPAEGDLIELSGIDANETTDDHEGFTFIGEYFQAGGFTAPGQVAYFYDNTNTFNTYIFLNTDADFVEDFDMVITLPGQHSLDASMFIFY